MWFEKLLNLHDPNLAPSRDHAIQLLGETMFELLLEGQYLTE
jgi:hypothetical protein